jgi:dTDP-4-amino-4,6-dideoxy-D-galactose acyltransferase
MSIDPQLLIQAALFHPMAFLVRTPEPAAQQFLQRLETEVAEGSLQVIASEGDVSRIYYRRLSWDTEYFGVPMYRVDFFRSQLSGGAAVFAYRDLLGSLKTIVSSDTDKYYVFAEVPSDAIHALQGICMAGWRLVESRLTYYNDRLGQFEYAQRFTVRQAVAADIPNLREVAAVSRNAFDRFHADFFFSPKSADAYLSTFVENSVKGFADLVLVPAVDELPPDAFLTGSFVSEMPEFGGKKIARMILSAVGEKRRGWYVKLIAEMSQYFKEHGVETCHMTTQSTNRAVIRTWEKLGYSFGRCAHVLVLTKGVI